MNNLGDIPRVVNIRNVSENTPGCVYIGRPSRWGNPFRTGTDGTRQQVIDKFEDWLVDNPQMLADVRQELRGKHLVCWCSPKQCHGDVLLHYANQDLDF